MPLESHDPLTTDLRLASKVEYGFPYDSKRVAFMVVDDGQIRQTTFKQARQLALRGRTVYGAWPGQWSQDVFVLDNITLHDEKGRKNAIEADGDAAG